jgi:hypothetical protein
MLNASIYPAFAQAAEDEAAAALSAQELERLVAPIALYPDSLLTHVLMAASYPLEIVQAQRWQAKHADLKGGELEDALKDEPWDESVKALVPFPQVLQMLSEKVDWAQQLGEAFLAQQDDVYAAVQVLRKRAETAGNLKTTKELRVSRAPALESGDSGDRGDYVVIEPAAPDEIYVPVYDPYVVYGTWPYADPPYYWYPYGWHRDPDRLFWFGTAAVLGVALWATWDWRRRGLNVDAARFNTFNRTNVVNPQWAFNPAHHKGVAFKNKALTKSNFVGNAKVGPVKGHTLAKTRIDHSLAKTGKAHTIAKTGTGTATVNKSAINHAKSRAAHVAATNKNVTSKAHTTNVKTHKSGAMSHAASHRTSVSSKAHTAHKAVSSHKSVTPHKTVTPHQRSVVHSATSHKAVSKPAAVPRKKH